MATEIFGASDDLIEVEGDVHGESYAAAGETLLICSDGTLLSARYPKNAALGVWGITVLRRGDLFDRLDECADADADRYSDTAHFRDGLKSVFAAKEWERVK